MSNYANSLYRDYEILEKKNKNLKYENKLLLIRAQVAESEQLRLEKRNLQTENLIFEKEKELRESKKENEALKNKIIKLTKQIDMTKYERDQYLAKLNIDGTNSGIPTSQTPINKKKHIPNSREKSSNNKGGQKSHKKHKLEKFFDEEINEHEEIILEECPNCHSHDLIELDSEVTKDEFDYKIKVIKKRIHFKEYKCPKCNKIVRKNIPINLKEDNQYGNNVQATALTLMNIGNVPINKTRKIINGLTTGEIDLSEGFISKLQKRASSKLEQFIKDLKFYITHLNLIYWDDTVVMINTKRGCMRFYGNEDVALYCVHEHKDKKGLDKDNILNMLPCSTIVEHDHNIINYNGEYSFVNAECCQHLLRDLQKVTDNLPNRTWSSKMKKLFQEYDHKRNELISKQIDRFSEEEFNTFVGGINQNLLLGVEENLKDNKVYYSDKEEALLVRLMEYRDNYIYWTLDFNLPFTNNLSERGLRGIKSKMKISGQFQNIGNAEYYAAIRSYLETCYRNNVNGHEALIRLLNNNPYTLEEILEVGRKNVDKSN